MNQLPSLQSPAKQVTPPSANPFAKALLETESSRMMQSGQTSGQTNPLAEALARSGGSFPDFSNTATYPGLGGSAGNYPFDDGMAPDWMGGQTQDPDAQRRAQEKARLDQEKKLLQKKLHDKVNPVDQTDVFNAREEQVKKQIEELRKELRAMAGEVKAFYKEVDITLMTETVEPGTSGTYFINFFHQLRQFIALLRQKIRSARTWLNTSKAKQKKKPKRGGILIQGSQHEQTASVFDTMHHERSSTYGGS